MKEGATGAGEEAGAELLYAAGKNSSDNASQVTAIENMVTAGAKGILITVADAKAENAAIEKARKAGVLVIALDTPTEPEDAVDALFATDNFKAGVLIGKYARAATQGQDRDDRDARRARRALGRRAAPQRLPQGLRHQGGRPADRLRRRTAAATRPTAQTAMENCCRRTRTSTSSTRSTSRAPPAPGRR